MQLTLSACTHSCSVADTWQAKQVVSRRAVSLTGLGALLLAAGGPAQALPGLPGATDKNEVYTQDTVRHVYL